MMFWDASAIIPLVLEEAKTKAARAITKEDSGLVVWWGSLIECYSAFARLRREGSLKLDNEDQIRFLLTVLSAEWTEIQPSQEIREISGRLLRIHPLHAADSLQLAAALIWSGKNPNGQMFVCLDRRLREAAKKEGFSLLPTE